MDVSRSTQLIVKPYLLRIPALTQNLYSFDSDGKVIINGDLRKHLDTGSRAVLRNATGATSEDNLLSLLLTRHLFLPL